MKKADIVAMIRKDVNSHKKKIEAMESQNKDYVKGNIPSGRKLTTKPKAKVRYRKDGSIDLRSYNRGRAAKGKAASVTITRRNKS